MPQEKDKITITWTRPKLNRFRTFYSVAKKNHEKGGSDVFVFEGHEFVVGYAQYLIEFLEKRL